MSNDIDVSVIIRARNEHSYLRRTLEAVVHQEFAGGIELIVVDNCSTDGSRVVAEEFTPHVLTIEEYAPGKALNMAIEFAQGAFIAVLSAHTIPASKLWLRNLRAYMDISGIGGVYGAQLYPFYSKFLDKRDLDIFSTLKPRVETHDSDFWNANSMFPRAVWQEQRFDECVFELEDHYWTKTLTPRGYRFYFAPEALVYHYAHVDRLDREHLPASQDDATTLIEKAVAVLEDPTASWPMTMRAGLTLSSMTKTPGIYEAIPAITRTLLEHEDFDVRWRMAQALGKLPDERSVRSLIQALKDPSFYPRDEAAWSLARLGKVATSAILESVAALPPETVVFAALALGKSGDKKAEIAATDILVEHLNAGDQTHARNAAYFAGEIAHAVSAHRLVGPLNRFINVSKDDELNMVCCWALGELGQYAEPMVDWNRISLHAANSSSLLTRFEAVIGLAKRAIVLSDPTLLLPLVALLDDPSSRVRFGVMQSIRRYLELTPHEVAIPRIGQVVNWRDDDNGVAFEQSLIRTLLSLP